MWLSLVERSVRDAEVAGSNPAIPTRKEKADKRLFLFLYSLDNRHYRCNIISKQASPPLAFTNTTLREPPNGRLLGYKSLPRQPLFKVQGLRAQYQLLDN